MKPVYGPKRFIDQFLEDAFPPERIAAQNAYLAAMDDLSHKVCVSMGFVRDPVVEKLIDERRAKLGLPPKEWPPLP